MMFTQLYRHSINLICNNKYHLYKNLISHKSIIGAGVLFVGYNAYIFDNHANINYYNKSVKNIVPFLKSAQCESQYHSEDKYEKQLIKFLNFYADGFNPRHDRFNDFGGESYWHKCQNIILSIKTDMMVRKVIVNNFHKLDFHWQPLVIACMINYTNETMILENKIISDFFKDGYKLNKCFEHKIFAKVCRNSIPKIYEILSYKTNISHILTNLNNLIIILKIKLWCKIYNNM